MDTDTRMRIGIIGLLVVVITAGGGLLLLGGGSDDDPKNADDLEWVCDRVEVDTPAVDPADTPEAAITETVADAELVAAHKTDDEALYAWVDADGQAVQSHTLERGADGWVTTEVQTCQD